MKQNPSLSTRAAKTSSRLKLLCIAVAASAITLTHAQVPIFSHVWSRSAGTNAAAGLPEDLPSNTGRNVRGLAIDPITGNIVYASTTAGTNGGNHFTSLAAADGSFLGQGVGTNVTGGSVSLSPIRVADDGSVYACNVSAAPASIFKIYKWPSSTNFTDAPNVVFQTGTGTSFQWRAGDYMDVRGAGLDTEIVVVGNGGAGANVTTNFLIFKATDSTATAFTNYSITIPGGVNRVGAGVTFEGTNNAIYCRVAGAQTVYRVVYNPAILTSSIASTFNMDQSANNGLKYFETNGLKFIASVCVSTAATTNTTVHRGKVLQLNGPSNAVVVLNQKLVEPYQGNGDQLGVVDYRNGRVVFGEPNNGVTLVEITGFITNTPPTIGGAPSGGGIYVEGYSPVSLSASASGTSPLVYQWYFNTNTPIPGATSNSWPLGAADLADAGTYSVIVTNLYGSITSAVTTVSVIASGHSTVATQVWTVAAGSRDYITSSGDTQRGLAYDPISQRLIVPSRAPTNGVHTLDAATGADIGELDISLLLVSPPGFFPINMAGVADDGAVYACNLILSGASDSFGIYRWADATNGSGMGVAYLANPGIGRVGDTLAVRGAGVNTEIIAGCATGTNIALFNTADGSTFNFVNIAVTNLPLDAQANGFARLGIAFGPTNTFWAKSSGFQLRLVRYDALAGTGEVIATHANPPNSVSPIGADNINNFIAGIGIGQIPQNISLYDTAASDVPALIDREYYAANNNNGNGTGAVAFDIAGGRIFSLDSNNGIVALNYAPRVNINPTVNGGIVSWTGPGVLQSASVVTGPYVDVSTSSPHTNTATSAQFFKVRR